MDLRSKRVLIVGLGHSGVAAARLCLDRGAHVVGTDLRSAEALAGGAPTLQALTGERLTLELGDHRRDSFLSSDLVVISPGVPPLPLLDEAREAGIPVIGELELAARFVRAPISAVTGTNGKSTTTSLVGRMLAESGFETFCGGNLGVPLSTAVLEHPVASSSEGRVVVEVSSFQLETVNHFHPKVAALLNLTDDHLDRYRSREEYAAAKARIFCNQIAGDFAVVPGDAGQAHCVASARQGAAQIISFVSDAAPALQTGGWLVPGGLRVRLPGGEEEAYPDLQQHLPGHHNQLNALAALLIARLAGATPAGCRLALESFRGLAHRMEFVRELRGVAYYNDSKATNVGAVVGSLRGFPRPIVLIAGGKDKGGDYAPLAGALRGTVRAAVLIGAAADRIAASLEGVIPLHRANTLPAAVVQAQEIAEAGDAVVLSPACSSFDMFENFEARGSVFRQAVAALDGAMR